MSVDLPTTIRPAIANDIPHLLALEEHCSTAAHWTKQQYQLSIQSSDQALRRLVLVAQPASSGENSSGILGFLVARSLGSEWELENIVVSPMFQRAGIGRGLVQELLSRVRETGGVALFLEVRESNAAARSLYEQVGFQSTGRRKSYYQNPQEDGILYRRNLY